MEKECKNQLSLVQESAHPEADAFPSYCGGRMVCRKSFSNSSRGVAFFGSLRARLMACNCSAVNSGFFRGSSICCCPLAFIMWVELLELSGRAKAKDRSVCMHLFSTYRWTTAGKLKSTRHAKIFGPSRSFGSSRDRKTTPAPGSPLRRRFNSYDRLTGGRRKRRFHIVFLRAGCYPLRASQARKCR
jgi:hypothetical protein